MKRPCICIVAGFALGEVVAYAIMTRDASLAVLMCIAAVILCIFLALESVLTDTDKRLPLVLLGIAFLLGGGRLILDMRTHSHDKSQDVLCTGNSKSYEAELTGITVKGERLTLRCGELLVYYTPGRDTAGGYSDAAPGGQSDISRIFSIGNRIRITGDFDVMDRPRNPGEFNYYLYYLADGITHRCFADSIEITDAHVSVLPDTIFRIRRALLGRIDMIYDDDDAGVLRAVLLGDKSELNEDINDLYRKNGIAHLLAISGLHVGIIGMSLYTLLRRRLKLSYPVCGIVCGTWVLFYCVLTGAGVSTVRATVMLLLSFLAGVPGMHYDMLNSAGIAALVILLIHPFQLFNCAFLLSFSCVVAIAGPANYIIKELRVKNPILKSFLLSISIQLFTLPVTAYFFFEISPYGCLLNLIVIPLMTFVVWSSLIATLLTFAWSAGAMMTAYISHFILALYTWLGGIASKLPGSVILIGRPSLWQIFAFYLLFLSVLYSSRLKVLIPVLRSLTWGRGTGSTSMQEKISSLTAAALRPKR